MNPENHQITKQHIKFFNHKFFSHLLTHVQQKDRCHGILPFHTQMALLFIDFEETYKQRLTWYQRTLRLNLTVATNYVPYPGHVLFFTQSTNLMVNGYSPRTISTTCWSFFTKNVLGTQTCWLKKHTNGLCTKQLFTNGDRQINSMAIFASPQHQNNQTKTSNMVS